MYKLCRWLLIVTVLELAVALGLFLYLFWPLSAIVLVGVYFLRRRIAGSTLTAFGTARWATERDLRSCGMVGTERGLAIGRLCDDSPPKPLESIWPLFNRALDDRSACEWSLRKRNKRRGEVVRLARAVHTAAFAPTGAGKGVSLILPWLFCSTENQCVLDLKGELARLTASYRERVFGHRVVLLDPFKVVTETPDSFNPLDWIDKDSSEMIDDCRDLANQLVVKSPEEREPHWNESAELFIAATTAAVVAHGQPQQCSLQSVRDILTNPQKLGVLINLLGQSEGMLPRFAGQLAHFTDRELGSALTTANRHLRFLDTPAIYDSTSSSSFDPHELASEKRVTVYCILPPHRVRAQISTLRMWCGSLLRAVVRQGLQDA